MYYATAENFMSYMGLADAFIKQPPRKVEFKT